MHPSSAMKLHLSNPSLERMGRTGRILSRGSLHNILGWLNTVVRPRMAMKFSLGAVTLKIFSSTPLSAARMTPLCSHFMRTTDHTMRASMLISKRGLWIGSAPVQEVGSENGSDEFRGSLLQRFPPTSM